MKKLFTSIAIVFFLGQGEANAQLLGYGGFWPFGGNEAARVMRANQAMICDLSNCWQPYQYPSYPTAQQVVIASPQGQVVCTPKPRDHQWKDVLGGAGLGAGVGLWAAGTRGAIGGTMAGAGGGTLYTNHEMECFLQPAAPRPQPPQAVPGQPQPPSIRQVPPAQVPIVVEPVPPRLTGVEFIVRNENPSTIIVEISDGRRAVLAPRARARVRTPDIKVYLIQRDDTTGSFNEFEVDLRTLQDESLPGWRIPAKVKLKNP